jgi:hypothetical protein
MPDGADVARCRRGHLVTIVLAGLFVSGTALADDAGLARCRAIADNAARLACYDALPLTGPETKAAPSGAPQAQLSQGAPLVIPADQFGFEERIIEKSGVPEIESRVQGKFEGWSPHSMIRLVNGQVWQVSDVDSRFYDLDSPEVTIARGALGAFYFNVKGDNRTVRVRRVQ